MSKTEQVDKGKQELIKIYGRSAKGNFGIIDTISVTHPYCIGPKHIQYSTGMYLDIPEAEKKGARCCTCQDILSKHETALVVECLKEPQQNNNHGAELQTYLKKVVKKKHFKEKGFVGVTLLDKFSGK